MERQEETLEDRIKELRFNIVICEARKAILDKRLGLFNEDLLACQAACCEVGIAISTIQLSTEDLDRASKIAQSME